MVDNILDEVLPPHPAFTTIADAVDVIETTILPGVLTIVTKFFQGQDTPLEMGEELLFEALSIASGAITDLLAKKSLLEVRRDVDDKLTDLLESMKFPSIEPAAPTEPQLP